MAEDDVAAGHGVDVEPPVLGMGATQGQQVVVVVGFTGADEPAVVEVV